MYRILKKKQYSSPFLRNSWHVLNWKWAVLWNHRPSIFEKVSMFLEIFPELPDLRYGLTYLILRIYLITYILGYILDIFSYIYSILLYFQPLSTVSLCFSHAHLMPFIFSILLSLILFLVKWQFIINHIELDIENFNGYMSYWYMMIVLVLNFLNSLNKYQLIHRIKAFNGMQYLFYWWWCINGYKLITQLQTHTNTHLHSLTYLLAYIHTYLCTKNTYTHTHRPY